MKIEIAALFGEDYLEPGVFGMHGTSSGRTWCSISVGGPAVLARKLGEACPNEDALCVVEAGERVLLAVADGHFGPSASHDLIERLQVALEARTREGVGVKVAAASAVGSQNDDDDALGSIDPIPRDLDDLTGLLATLADAEVPDDATADAAEPTEEKRSESTLVVAIVERKRREVWGVSVGDSSAVALGLDAGVRWLTTLGRSYVNPAVRASLEASHLTSFRARLEAGDVVAVFTDGVNECQYGSPETSIGDRHLEALLIRTSGRVERFVESLTEHALSGVDGHPGGEDNVALAATRV